MFRAAPAHPRPQPHTPIPRNAPTGSAPVPLAPTPSGCRVGCPDRVQSGRCRRCAERCARGCGLWHGLARPGAHDQGALRAAGPLPCERRCATWAEHAALLAASGAVIQPWPQGGRAGRLAECRSTAVCSLHTPLGCPLASRAGGAARRQSGGRSDRLASAGAQPRHPAAQASEGQAAATRHRHPALLNSGGSASVDAAHDEKAAGGWGRRARLAAARHAALPSLPSCPTAPPSPAPSPFDPSSVRPPQPIPTSPPPPTPTVTTTTPTTTHTPFSARSNWLDEEEDDEEAATRPATRVEVDLGLSAHANARAYYDSRRKHQARPAASPRPARLQRLRAMLRCRPRLPAAAPSGPGASAARPPACSCCRRWAPAPFRPAPPRCTQPRPAPSRPARR